MKFEKLELGFAQMNCYVLFDEASKDAIIIDPGYDFKIIDKFIVDYELLPKLILLTHSHGDHIGAVEELKKKYNNLQLGVNENEVEMLKNPELNLSTMIQRNPVSLDPDFTFINEDEFLLGDEKIQVIHTPGHSPGGSCFHIGDILFSGDTLFKQSVGRSDLYMGDTNQLVKSIKNKLFRLKDSTLVYPGHGRETTIGDEKERNPYLKWLNF